MVTCVYYRLPDVDRWDSPQVICLVIFGSLMSIVFIYSEKRFAKYPVMPLEIFKERSNIACLVLGFLHGFVSLDPITPSSLHLQN